jgi:hypothetical protein
MATFKLRETNIPQQFKMMFEQDITVTNEQGEQISFCLNSENNPKDQSNDTTDTFSALILTIASIMSLDAMKKVKDGKVALVFSNTKGIGELLLACIAEYTEENGEGNWYYSLTFNQDDIKGIKPDNIHNYTDLSKICPFAVKFNDALYELHSKSLGDTELVNQMVLIAIKCIINWLDSAAVEDEVTELIIDDAISYSENISKEDYENSFVTFATASVEVVKGVKQMSMSFGEEILLIAKGNSDSI